MDREKIERKIRGVIALEDIGASAFSRLLFGVNGLIYQLAGTEQERRNISKTALFQEANARLTELENREIAELDAIRQRRKAVPEKLHIENGANGSAPVVAAPETIKT